MIAAMDVSKFENYNRGVSLYDQGLYTESIEEFEQVIDIAEENSPEWKLASFYMCEAYTNLGQSHLRMSMFRRAEKELKLAVLMHPDYADLHCSLGITCYKQGRYDESQSHLDKALEINPTYARALVYRGMSRLRKGDPNGMRDLSDGVSAEPVFCGDKYAKAVALYHSGDLDRCLLLMEEIAETDTDQAGDALNRGLELMNRCQYEEAAQEFLGAVSSCPQYADLRHHLGVCYLNQGMVDVAIGQFRKAVEINPSFKAARISLAGAYAKAGKVDLAARELQAVKQMDPHNIEAGRLLTELPD